MSYADEKNCIGLFAIYLLRARAVAFDWREAVLMEIIRSRQCLSKTQKGINIQNGRKVILH